MRFDSTIHAADLFRANAARWLRLCISAALFFAVQAISPVSQAADGSTITQTNIKRTEALEIHDQATNWGLSSQEWKQYEEVMASKRGLWSPGLDPLSALGVSANTPSERKRFAELYVRAEFERVRKELAFQVEVDAAWKRLYPNTPRLLDVARAKPDSRVTRRYAVVVSDGCRDCKSVVQRHLELQASMDSGKPLDVHVVGTGGDDARLRAWAKENRWLESALRENRATLNHGDDFAELSQFPVVYAKKGGGQWEREL